MVSNSPKFKEVVLTFGKDITNRALSKMLVEM